MRTYPDLTGNRYGRLTVIGLAESSGDGKRRWICKCDCGEIRTVQAGNLTSGHTTSCGCKKSPDLSGRKFGKLTVLGRSEKRVPRGLRSSLLWECRCECGNIVYRPTDVLNNADTSMCQECANAYATTLARAGAGFVGGTQIGKLKTNIEESSNLTGARGVYLERKTGKYRARIKFQGKLYNLGSYANLEDAVKARRQGEMKFFGEFLATVAASDANR